MRGAVSMARTNEPNSARSQFFIVFKDSNFLDGQYTVWGKVVSGMEFVDKIKRGAAGSGAVAAPADKMIKVQVAADAKKLEATAMEHPCSGLLPVIRGRKGRFTLLWSPYGRPWR